MITFEKETPPKRKRFLLLTCDKDVFSDMDFVRKIRCPI